jgi:RNA polymerase sigma factor (sigma-70 family)
MINEKEAQELILKFIELKKQLENDNSVLPKFKEHQKLCMNKFKYLVTMRTSRYKKFNNYEDLNQEGLEVLYKAMNNYNPTKGSWFWWAHKYIDTKISRIANLHTAIRYPLKKAKFMPPHKENNFPILVDPKTPGSCLEDFQMSMELEKAIEFLPDAQKKIISLFYGLEGNKPLSINQICLELGISRSSCVKNMNNALGILRNNFKI